MSSTYEDLVEHRRAVVDALERLDLLAGTLTSPEDLGYKVATSVARNS